MPRFAAPRSISPSPERPSEETSHRISVLEESDLDSEDDTESSVTASSNSSWKEDLDSSEEDTDTRPTRRPPQSTQTREHELEAQRLADALASIRLRTRHHDAYELWANTTKRDALNAAKLVHSDAVRERDAAASRRLLEAERIQAAMHAKAAQDAAALLRAHADATAKAQVDLQTRWKADENAMRTKLQMAIQEEEARIAKIEEARKREELKAQMAAEDALKAKLEAEKKALAEKERKEKEALERRAKEEEAKKKAEEDEREKEEQKQKDEVEARKKEETKQMGSVGVSTALDDWKIAREALLTLKSGPMAAVKGNKPLKSQWLAIRRQITPKIGQLTPDEQAINLITEQISGLLSPSPPLPAEVYIAGLSALSKAILLQAETEVTAVPKAAGPLAAVTARLLSRLPDFDRVFWARLVQRSGAWCVPCAVPTTEPSGQVMEGDKRKKANGVKEGETAAEYGVRITGIMRTYFEILKVSVQPPAPLGNVWRLPRAWTWLTRLVARPGMMTSPVAALSIYALLDVLGGTARDVWGVQWIKLLALVYAGATQGIGPAPADGRERPMLGGDKPEGRAARVRVQLEVERLLRTVP